MSKSQTLTIHIERQPDGEYAAIDEDTHDLGGPVGYGKTRRAAIERGRSKINGQRRPRASNPANCGFRRIG